MGEYAIEAIRIEDTPVANFAEIDYEVIAPGGAITKFPTNVVSSVEVSGQELAGSLGATYSQSGTTITVNMAAHGYAVGQVLYLASRSCFDMMRCCSLRNACTYSAFIWAENIEFAWTRESGETERA